MRARVPGNAPDADKPRASKLRAAARAPQAGPGALSPGGLLALQRSIGNAAAARVVEEARHQHTAGCGHQEAAAPVQRSGVHEVLRGSGRPMDAPLQQEMEARLGADFSDVRLHTGGEARRSAAEIGARAYTSGSDIVIGGSGADKHTLAHELTHVIQQRQGPVAGTDNGEGLAISSPDDRFEREAETNAHRVLGGPAPEVHDHTQVARLATAPLQRATAVQRARDTRADAPRVDGNRLLDMLVGRNRTLAGFQFSPECRNNGGNNLISRPVEVVVKDGTRVARLAVHLNVVLTTGGERATARDSSKVEIKGELFHLTARRLGSQNLIHQAGASSLTAGESIHVGRSNAAAGWNSRLPNTQSLADAVGVPLDTIVETLSGTHPPGEINALIERFKHDAGRVIIHALQPEVVTVEWSGDSSFG
ncbi:DUF4157 domain-containing protein [Streptomyces sp. NPDC086010]|uniref:DUF4157 domain-containing protein n=1 Tax=Streptomyces sp. NPDC086010 TaxID=3365745 RepID=UPI0037D547E3